MFRHGSLGSTSARSSMANAVAEAKASNTAAMTLRKSNVASVNRFINGDGRFVI